MIKSYEVISIILLKECDDMGKFLQYNSKCTRTNTKYVIWCKFCKRKIYVQKIYTLRIYSKGLTVVISEKAMDEFNFPLTVLIENLRFSLMIMCYICKFF